jgi:NAD-dependent dihydropyrimidine dehydrogenase PreA subunit
MSDEFNLKMLGDLKREDINWSPCIDSNKCSNCGKCLEFCKHDVYGLDNLKTIVKNPYNCILLCNKCEDICPAQAINFPNRIDTLKLIRTLNQQEKKKR